MKFIIKPNNLILWIILFKIWNYGIEFFYLSGKLFPHDSIICVKNLKMLRCIFDVNNKELQNNILEKFV